MFAVPPLIVNVPVATVPVALVRLTIRNCVLTFSTPVELASVPSVNVPSAPLASLPLEWTASWSEPTLKVPVSKVMMPVPAVPAVAPDNLPTCTMPAWMLALWPARSNWLNPAELVAAVALPTVMFAVEAPPASPVMVTDADAGAPGTNSTLPLDLPEPMTMLLVAMTLLPRPRFRVLGAPLFAPSVSAR